MTYGFNFVKLHKKISSYVVLPIQRLTKRYAVRYIPAVILQLPIPKTYGKFRFGRSFLSGDEKIDCRFEMLLNE